MDLLKQYIQRVYKVTEVEWDLVKDYFQTEELKAGKFFVQSGKICYRLGYIEEGVIRHSFFKESGKEVTCSFSSEEEFIGESDSFIQQKPCPFNQQATTDCTLVTFTLEGYNTIIKKLPRAREIFEDIGYRTVRALLDKRTIFLGSDATSKYMYLIHHYPRILQRVPLGYIASYLDITQQSLSRIRKQIS
jgi:CRP-like cAMP-binding protein